LKFLRLRDVIAAALELCFPNYSHQLLKYHSLTNFFSNLLKIAHFRFPVFGHPVNGGGFSNNGAEVLWYAVFYKPASWAHRSEVLSRGVAINEKALFLHDGFYFCEMPSG